MRCREHGGEGYSSECDLCSMQKQTEEITKQREQIEEQRDDAMKIAVAQIEIQGDIARENRKHQADLAKLAEKQNDILRRGTPEKCPKCERPVSGNLGRCPGCAIVLQDVCVNCGQENFVGWKFCCRCGLDRDAAAIKAKQDSEEARTERKKRLEKEKREGEERAKRDEAKRISAEKRRLLESELNAVIVPERIEPFSGLLIKILLIPAIVFPPAGIISLLMLVRRIIHNSGVQSKIDVALARRKDIESKIQALDNCLLPSP